MTITADLGNFHYTSLAGLQGMLQSNTLWATHYRFLNDPSEGQYKRHSHAKQLAAHCKSHRPSLKYSDDWFLELFREIEAWVADTYVFSMSANSRSASQWMTYGCNGNGVCIKFDFSICNLKLYKHPGSEYGSLESATVQYEDPEASIPVSMLDAELAGYFDLPEHVQRMANARQWPLDNLTPQQLVQLMINTPIMSDLKLRFRRNITNRLISIKHLAYAAEQETRIYTNFANPSSTPSGVRLKGDELIPYRELYVDDKLPISEVILGPCLGDNQGFAVHHLLRKYNYEAVKISKSNVPLRSHG